MRHVMNHPDEVASKGREARRVMLERFSPEAVAEVVSGHLGRIKRGLRARTIGNAGAMAREWGEAKERTLQ